jgi:UDP-N-acetylglucosamine 2-epimerase
MKTLEVINELEIPTFWFWPNVDAGSDGTSNGIRSFRESVNPKHIHFFKNMEPNDFLRLLVNSKCLVGNSSVGIRECAYLGVPVVNIGTRQNGRDRGENVLDVDYTKEAIRAAIKTQIEKKNIVSSPIYGDGDAGHKIAEVLSKCPLDYHKTITF